MPRFVRHSINADNTLEHHANIERNGNKKMFYLPFSDDQHPIADCPKAQQRNAQYYI